MIQAGDSFMIFADCHANALNNSLQESLQAWPLTELLLRAFVFYNAPSHPVCYDMQIVAAPDLMLQTRCRQPQPYIRCLKGREPAEQLMHVL